RSTTPSYPCSPFFGISFHLFFVLLEPFKHEQSLASSMLGETGSKGVRTFCSSMSASAFFFFLVRSTHDFFFTHRRVPFFVASSLSAFVCSGVNATILRRVLMADPRLLLQRRKTGATGRGAKW